MCMKGPPCPGNQQNEQNTARKGKSGQPKPCFLIDTGFTQQTQPNPTLWPTADQHILFKHRPDVQGKSYKTRPAPSVAAGKAVPHQTPS